MNHIFIWMYRMLFHLLLIPAMPFILIKSFFDSRYRYRLGERLGSIPHCRDKKVIWCHAASVGEVLMSTSLIQRVTEELKEYDILYSAQTPSGHEMVVKSFGNAVKATLVPLDSPFTVRRALRRITPAMFILFETEFWPELLFSLQHRGIPMVLVNGRISDRSFPYYLALKAFMHPLLTGFRMVGVQNEAQAQRFRRLGVPAERVVVTGNLKWDRAPQPPGEELRRAMQDCFADDGETVLSFGSVHKDEISDLVAMFSRLQQQFPTLKAIWAPRHLEDVPLLTSQLSVCGIPFRLRTDGSIEGEKAAAFVLDSYGELASSYALADIVFVGGSLVPHGGQNLLEAIAFKKPVLVGPHTFNFKEITEQMVRNGGAIRVQDMEELESQAILLVENESRRTEVGEKGYQLFAQHRGAVERVFQVIREELRERDNDTLRENAHHEVSGRNQGD